MLLALQRAERGEVGPARFRDCDQCPEMIEVPAGSFMMGSPSSESGRDNDEGPRHRVRIAKPFAAGVYEVTFDEWDACRRGGRCSHTPGDKGLGPRQSTGHQRELGGCAGVREVAVEGDGGEVPAVERVGVGVRGACGDEDALLLGRCGGS